METGTKFCSRFHCIQGKRKFRFSSLKNNHPFLVLKGVTEMSFLVLKRISGISEEDQYFILLNCSLVIELQFGNIEY